MAKVVEKHLDDDSIDSFILKMRKRQGNSTIPFLIVHTNNKTGIPDASRVSDAVFCDASMDVIDATDSDKKNRVQQSLEGISGQN